MVAIVLSYYRQPEALAWQLERLEPFWASDLELILVDDGSGDEKALGLLKNSSLRSTLITVQVDKPWNIPEARNWGMVFAGGDTVFRSDIDHRPTEKTMEDLLQLRAKRGLALTFRRIALDGCELHRHTDTFLMSKADYWEIGGYDEYLSGSYGSNAQDFISRSERIVSIQASDMTIETSKEFATMEGSRDVRVNKRKLRRRNHKKHQPLLHLQSSVTVSRFNYPD